MNNMNKLTMLFVAGVALFAGCSFDTEPPGPVSDLSATVSDESTAEVTVTWTDPVDPDLADIEVTLNSRRTLETPAGEEKETSLWSDFGSYEVVAVARDESGNRSTEVSTGVTVPDLSSSAQAATFSTEANTAVDAGNIDADSTEWWVVDMSSKTSTSTLEIELLDESADIDPPYTADLGSIIVYNEAGEFLERADFSAVELEDGTDYDSSEPSDDEIFFVAIGKAAGDYGYIVYAE